MADNYDKIDYDKTDGALKNNNAAVCFNVFFGLQNGVFAVHNIAWSNMSSEMCQTKERYA